MKIGIIGNGADKFTPHGTTIATKIIRKILLVDPMPVLVSGHSKMGGVDIWAEEIAIELGLESDIKAPKTESWSGDCGYKERNTDIAKASDYLYIIVADSYPAGYKGRQFLRNGMPYCYHCDTFDHLKSGACYTGKLFEKLTGRLRITMIIPNTEGNVVYKVGNRVLTEEMTEWRSLF